DQQPALALDGREYPGGGQAGAHGARQIAGAHDYRLARLQVGGDGTERRRQIVEVAEARDRQRQAPQGLGQPLPLDQSAREYDLAAAQAEREVHEEGLVLLLAAQGQILARWLVAERTLPVDGGHDAFDVARGQAARVQAADHRTHAGAGDRI